MKPLCVFASLLAALTFAWLASIARASVVAHAQLAAVLHQAATGTLSASSQAVPVVSPEVLGDGHAPTAPPGKYLVPTQAHELKRHVPTASYNDVGLESATARLSASGDEEVEALSHGASASVSQIKLHTDDKIGRLPTPQPTSELPVSVATNEAGELDIGINYAWHDHELNFATNSNYDPTKQIAIACENCALGGQIGVKQHGWTDVDGDPQMGFLNISLSSFSNTIKLRVQGNESGSVTYPFAPGDGDIPIPLSGFKVPGLGKIGLMLHPELYFDWNLTDPLALWLDFALSMEGRAVVRLNFQDINATSYDASTMKLRADRRLDAPSADVTNGNASISLGLRVHLKVVLDLGLAGASTEVGLHMDLPSAGVQTSAHPVGDFKNMCRGTREYAEPSSEALRVFADTYTTFVRTTARAGLAFGADFDAEVPGLPADAYHTGWNSTQSLAPLGLCHVWNPNSKELSDTMQVLANISDSLQGHQGPDHNGNFTQGSGDAKKSGALVVTLLDTAWIMCMGGFLVVEVAFSVFF